MEKCINKRIAIGGGKKPFIISFCIICLFIFSFLFYCNVKTPYILDDYLYMLDLSYKPSFYPPLDAPRIQSIWQIFPSMAAHRVTLNGRVIAHFLAQLFLMLPKSVFNIVNSIMFLIQIILIYCCANSIIKLEGKYLIKLLLLLSIFTSIWILQPMFGQVNLWLDAAVNYLWAAVFSVLFIFLCIRIFVNPLQKRSVWFSIFFMILSFIVGSYCENAAISIICFLFLLLLSYYVFKRKRPPLILCISFLFVLLGFAFLLSAPAELSAKVANNNSINLLTYKFILIFDIMKEFKLLWIIAILLLIIAIWKKTDEDSIIIAAILMICAVVSCGCLIIGAYVAERNFFITVVLLLMAAAILLISIVKAGFDVVVFFCALSIMVSPYFLAIGFKDLGEVNTVVQENISNILSCREKGIYDVTVKNIYPQTKYSVFYDVEYVSQDPNVKFPNPYIARYYGLNSIRREETESN